MKVLLGNINKRTNSTKQISEDDFLLSIECILKDECSVTDPVISVIFPNVAISASSINYAFIPTFSRYYFVTNVSFAHNRVIFTLKVDVLASFKTNILNSTQYVLRSASKWDLNVGDGYYPTTNNITQSVITFDAWTASTMPEGCYVVGIVNNSVSAVGGITYYRLSASEFSTLRNAMLSDYSYMGISDLSLELQKAIIDPFKYIVSCKWFPEVPWARGDENIPVGSWSIAATGHKLTSAISWQDTKTFTLSKHPQISRGYWLSKAPYSTYTLNLPPFGMIAIESDKISWNTPTISINRKIDHISGQGSIEIKDATTGTLIYYGVTDIGVPIQLAQSSLNITTPTSFQGLFTEALSAAGTLALGAGYGAAHGQNASSSITSGATSVISKYQQTTTTGTNGSIVQYATKGSITQRFVHIVNADNANLGTPLCESVQLLSLIHI